MAIGIVTVEHLVRVVAERWRKQYITPGAFARGGPFMDIYKKLEALPKDATIKDVAEIIGNDSWVTLRCDECGRTVDRIATFRPNGADGITYLCADCLRSALYKLEHD